MLSNGADDFRELASGQAFPFAYVVAGTGFLLILLIEGVLTAEPDPEQSPLHCGFRRAAHEIELGIQTIGAHPETFVLLLVLSIHSIILGLASGTQMAAFFSSMALVGIVMGAAIYTLISPGGRLLFEAIFNSVGAGTFLYSATLDMIWTEFELPAMTGRNGCLPLWDSVSCRCLLFGSDRLDRRAALINI